MILVILLFVLAQATPTPAPSLTLRYEPRPNEPPALIATWSGGELHRGPVDLQNCAPGPLATNNDSPAELSALPGEVLTLWVPPCNVALQVQVPLPPVAPKVWRVVLPVVSR